MINFLSPISTKVYACLNYLSYSNNGEKEFSLKCIEDVLDMTIQTFSKDKDDDFYLDEWIFKFNSFDEDEEFLKAKGKIQKDLSNVSITDPIFIDTIYFNARSLIQTAVIAELQLNSLLSISISNPTYVLNKTIPIDKVYLYIDLLPNKLYTKTLKKPLKKDTRELQFLCEKDNGYLYLTSNTVGELLLSVEFDLIEATCVIKSKNKQTHNSLISGLCILDLPIQTIIDQYF